MKARKILQILAILVLLLWGGTFIYFYASGRIENHVDKSFRTWALVAGLGLCVMGLFNLATVRQREVCTHDHGDGEGEGHSCGHDHDHDHGYEHHHEEEHAHAHSHAHDHHHEHGQACCGHDHHDHDHEHHGHGHELHDHEQPPSAVLTAVIILTIPLLMAARFSKDSFSSEYLQKWGKIERQIYQLRLAEKRAARAEAAKTAAATAGADAPPQTTAAKPGEDTADTPPTADQPKDSTDETAAADTPPAGEEGDEWGAFTMADLERMVPKNSEGNFLLDVPQIFYTAGDEELMAVMEGVPVETTAQVMEETLHNPNGTRLKLFRLFVECCAADARPLSIPIEFGEKPPAYEELGWVKVIGKIHYSEEDGDIVPLINVDSMEPTAEPMDMMMY